MPYVQEKPKSVFAWPPCFRLTHMVSFVLTVAILEALIPTALAVSEAKIPLSTQASAFSAPKTPLKPRQPQAAGAAVQISAAPQIESGGTVWINIDIANHALLPFAIGIGPGFPSWASFHGTWCWGPRRHLPTMLLRLDRERYRLLIGGSCARITIDKGRSASIPPINFSRIFDLTIPGRYQAQLAGRGMISNVVKFRVLPPKLVPTGPAIVKWVAQPGVNLKNARWGVPWHGIRMAAVAYNNPARSCDPLARVVLLFRCAHDEAETFHLTGNPEIDFSHCNLAGPYRCSFKAIEGKPVPPTAYGKLLAGRHWSPTPKAKAFKLRPGIVYAYWRPLLLNRRFDLSVYGPYRFSTRLAGTRLRSRTIALFVGVAAFWYKPAFK